jgi:5'-methylthioadenosine phosphorylase
MKIGLIGGTGFAELLQSQQEVTVRTEFGDVALLRGSCEDKEIYFLLRHGKHHETLAPDVNYRANMLALKRVGVDRVIAVSAVGSIHPGIPIGSLTLLSQFVDFTRRRDNSYGTFSVDMTYPFCPDVRAGFLRAAEQKQIPLIPDTTIICVDGPIYETRAELQLYATWGMDVVGMTAATEAALARELGLCYSVVTLTTDMATGCSDVPPDLATHKQVAERHNGKVRDLLLGVLSQLNETKSCACQEAYIRATAAHAQGGK